MRHFLVLVVAGLAFGAAGCGDDVRTTDGGPDTGVSDGGTDGGDVGPDGGDAGPIGACTPRTHTAPTITECPGAMLPAPATGTCTTTAGSDAMLITADVLTPGEVLRGGQVLVDASGNIACADCDCSGAAGAAGATTIVCPQAVVSPGLINSHDHLGWVGSAPGAPTDERFEHRHDWREGNDGHTEISTPRGDGSGEWGELRQVMAGSTSVNGGPGNAGGLLRNLDIGSGLEGLAQPDVNYDTFPLGDGRGTTAEMGCSAYDLGESASSIASDDAYTPHVAEGIALTARNEFLCMRDGADDLIQENVAIIHGIGLLPQDIGEMAADGTMLIWSPRTNVSLYGETARLSEYSNLGVPIALGTDWILSGSMNILRELRCADELNSFYMNEHFSDEELWLMATQNAAEAMAMDDAIGIIASGRVADLAIFATRGTRVDHRAVIEADPQDVVLVMRGGDILYGDADVVGTATTGCDTLDVCGVSKQACTAREVGMSFSALEGANGGVYPLFFCDGQPTNEPSCVPARDGMSTSYPSPEVDGSNRYTGELTMTDGDGDGIADDMDNCPCHFNPIRPLDMGGQADTDGDGTGDACDPCPFDEGLSGCAPPDPTDRDRDTIPNTSDNCPDDANLEQEDRDMDGKGDVCDACPDDANPGGAACPSTVYDVQRGDVPDGTAVSVSGLVVTGVASNGFYAQQAVGTADYDGVDYSGIFIYTGGAPTVSRGDAFDVTSGTVSEFGGQAQLINAALANTGSDMEPAPETVTPAEIGTGGTRAETLQSVLVQVTGLTVTNANPDGPDSDFGEFEVNGALRIEDQMYATEPDPVLDDEFAAITGNLGFSFTNSKLRPRDAADVIPANMVLLPRSVSATPSSMVTLTALIPMPAPTGGATVNLVIAPAGLLVGPAAITIPAGMQRGSATFTASATEATGMVTASYMGDMSVATVSVADISGTLVISEYIEGSSNNKALELTAIAPIDLGTCEIRRYQNGAASPSGTFSPTGSLAAGETYVVCNSSIADSSNCDDTDNFVQHNGNDAYEVVCSAVVVDSFGRVGEDPGLAWTGSGASSQNETLRRRCGTEPDVDSSDAFDPGANFDSFAQDDLSDLGSWSCI